MIKIRNICLNHVRIVIFDLYEPRTLQGLLQDFKRMLKNFGFDSNNIKFSYVKDIIKQEFENDTTDITIDITIMNVKSY